MDGGGMACSTPHPPAAVATESQLNTQNGSGLPSASADSAGRAGLAWAELDALSGRVVVKAKVFNGLSWSSPTTFSSLTVDSVSPSIAVDAGGGGSGYAILAYLQGGAVQATVYDFAMGLWSAPVPVSSSANPGAPRAVMNSGHGVVAWAATVSPKITSAAVLKNPVGPLWSGEVPLSNAAADAPEFDVAINSSGDAIAVFAQQVPVVGTLPYARWYVAATSTWLPGAKISTNAGASAPRVTLDDMGGATATWNLATNPPTLWGNHGTQAAWGTFEREIDGAVGAVSPTQRLAHDLCGDAVVVFPEVDATGKAALYMTRFSNGWSPAVPVANSQLDVGPDVDVGMTNDGTAFAVFDVAPSGGARQAYAVQIGPGPATGPFAIQRNYSQTGPTSSALVIGVTTAGKAFAAWNETAAPNVYVFTNELTWQ
jgi:hypothetical protein